MREPIEGVIVVNEATPRCGCCGTPVNGDWKVRFPLTLVGTVDGHGVWRCDRHIGRNPCCIAGCGRTFAHKPDKDGRGAEDYSWTIICGRHWRMAPKFMRDAVARVRRRAKNDGWIDRHLARHTRLFDRCVRAIRDGQTIDPAEIHRMFGLED